MSKLLRNIRRSFLWTVIYHKLRSDKTEEAINLINEVSRNYSRRPDQTALLATAYGRLRDYSKSGELFNLVCIQTNGKLDLDSIYINLYAKAYLRRLEGNFNDVDLIKKAEAIQCSSSIKRRLPLCE